MNDDAIPKPIAPSYAEGSGSTLNLGDGGAKLQGGDHRSGLQYLPMDVFVDSKTTEQHFQGSSVRTQPT